MKSGVVEVEIKSLLPTQGGCAVFLGNDEKIFTIFIDAIVGNAILMFLKGMKRDRPMTHDLMVDLITAFGGEVQRVVINDARDGIYFARLIILSTNEIEEKKLIELDARPSDSIALAVQAGAPIYVAAAVWEEVEDMSDVLEKVEGLGLSGDDLGAC